MNKEEEKALNIVISNIQNIIKKSGLSLSEISDRSGISISYLSRVYRKQKRNLSILIILKLSVALGVGPETLLNGIVNNDKHRPMHWSMCLLIMVF